MNNACLFDWCFQATGPRPKAQRKARHRLRYGIQQHRARPIAGGDFQLPAGWSVRSLGVERGWSRGNEKWRREQKETPER